MNTLPPSWSVASIQQIAAHPGQSAPTESMALRPQAHAYLSSKYPAGLYLHQKAGIEKFLGGEDICLATPTASGKTAVFHTAAIELLARNPKARVLALYPMKALGSEQEGRWADALARAGMEGKVGRIDGGVHSSSRNAVCSRSRVLIATPDVIHTWLLPKVGQRGFEATTRFMAGLELVVLDEAHTYTGVFGSNAAFAFRRLQHSAGLLGTSPRFIAASATMAEPKNHLERLTGRTFSVLGEERDTSHHYATEIQMVRPPTGADFNSSVSSLLGLLRDGGEQFLAFVDSRKATEQLSAIAQRDSHREEPEAGFDHLLDQAILPFRAGYEAEHRATIQERLSNGSLRGVVCTSTLELGLDLPHLKTVVLVGVPGSGTNLRQRIGRVGRSAPGRVIIVHSGSLADDLTFAHPEKLFDKPLYESTIYLENRRVQYAHAMALARTDGEHDRALAAAGRKTGTLAGGGASWPEGFLELCDQERNGVVPPDLQDMKQAAGDQPTHTFMLRDVEQQFEVQSRRGSDRFSLGSLSHSQVMREAYPGAVYYYTGKPYRVLSVDQRSRIVHVTKTAHYHTQPVPVHARMTPQRDVHGGVRSAALTLVECDLQIWRAVLGFRLRRGSSSEQVNYPCESPVRFDRQNFSRTLFTTGVCLTHPALNAKGVDLDVIAGFWLEAFLIAVPLERQDVDVDHDVLRSGWAGLEKGTRYLSLFDQASGSLRITSRLRDPEVLRRVLDIMVDLLASRDTLVVKSEQRILSQETKSAIVAIHADAQRELATIGQTVISALETDRMPVLLPKSHVTCSEWPNLVFEIHNVFVHPVLGLAYRGVCISEDGGRSEGRTIPIAAATPIEGKTHSGFYDLETGEQVAA